jgi:hypothetical protein
MEVNSGRRRNEEPMITRAVRVRTPARRSANSGGNRPSHRNPGRVCARRPHRARQLADQRNVMVVTVNYRLGVFGYFSHPRLGADSGDYGLEDQVAASKSVQRLAPGPGGITAIDPAMTHHCDPWATVRQ